MRLGLLDTVNYFFQEREDAMPSAPFKTCDNDACLPIDAGAKVSVADPVLHRTRAHLGYV